MVTRKHFDGFGDNYLTYGVGLGDDGETVVSGTKFDAVGAAWSLVSEPILNDYAFVYEYDECMRVVSKKLPGCEPVRYCYDRCGQLAFSQDGNRRDEGRRMFYLYDTAGRPTLTGLCDAPSTWAAYTDTAMISSRADNRAIDKTYYSAPVALGNPKMLNAWYYDTYINLPDHYYDLSVVRHGLLTISSSALMPPVGDQDRIVTSNYYDFDDRLCESTTDIAGGGTINTRTVYTISGQVDSVWATTRLPGKAATVDRYKYRYDHADRLKSVTFYHDGGAPVVLAVNGYDALGRLATAKLPGETVSYGYNVRDALTYISSPRFSQQLHYAAGAAAPCYNGNIAEAVTQGNKYAYTYDNANRLTSAKYTPSAGDADYSATYAYDRNSNITALTRKGVTGRLGTFGTVDDLTMTYDGNRLSKVAETADEVLLETSHDIRPAAVTRPAVSQFGYDANGNTTMDRPRSVSSITYNPLNQPRCVAIDNSPNNLISSPTNKKYVNYTYDASGVKHRVIHSSTKPYSSSTGKRTTADTTDYVGNRVYLNGKLDKVLTPYGYLQGGKFHTWLHDYQGNIAAVVVGDSVAQRNSYYPYGLPHATSSLLTNVTFTTPNTHKYSGKEFDTFGGTDLYDFHARHHAPSTGRFMTVDPLAEKYPGISPYMYCAGNPIAYIDPDGMQIFVNIDDMIYYYREIEKGRYGFVDEDGNEYDGDDNFIYSVEQALNTLREGEVGRTLVDEMVSCSDNFCIKHSFKMDDSWFGVDKTIVNGIECYVIGWDSSSIKGGPSILSNESVSHERPSFISLGHELAHGQDRVYGRWDSSIWFVNNLDITTKADIYATHIENMIRAEHGLPLRTHYDSGVPNSRIIMNGNLSIYYAPFRYRIKNF